MILYLPERLYDEIKDNQDFIDISEQMEDIYTEKNTFEHAITTNWVDNDEIKALGIKLDKLIETFFKDKPNYIEEYKINNGKYSKQEMIVKYETGNSEVYDYENKFFLLSNILNKSYEDGTYTEYMKPYVNLFESTSLEEKKEMNLSKYIWLKYMHAKLYVMATKINFVDMKWDKSFADQALQLLDELNVYDDTDIFENSFLEAYLEAVQTVMVNIPKLPSQEILNLLGRVNGIVNEKSFQYYNCSFSVLSYMDTINNLYLFKGDFTAFHHMTSTIVDYINDSLYYIENTLRGLSYYDKSNHAMYAILIRKYLKLTDYCDYMRDIKIKYLSDTDKEFILSDRLGSDVSTNPFNGVVESRTLEDCDSFFKNNFYLENLKHITVE